MADRAMGDREYVTQGGLVCPFCRNGGIEPVSGMDSEARQCWQEILCRGCGRVWRDIYELTGYEILDEDGNAVATDRRPGNATSLYLLLVWSDVEPDLAGPFADETERGAYARHFREKHWAEHGIFALDIPDTGRPEVEGYSGGFFEDKEKAAA